MRVLWGCTFLGVCTPGPWCSPHTGDHCHRTHTFHHRRHRSSHRKSTATYNPASGASVIRDAICRLCLLLDRWSGSVGWPVWGLSVDWWPFPGRGAVPASGVLNEWLTAPRAIGSVMMAIMAMMTMMAMMACTGSARASAVRQATRNGQAAPFLLLRNGRD